MRGLWHGRRSERGSTIAIMAVMLFAMLAMAAFAIDLASLRSARSEAQRAADAIALAGASAFYDLPSGDATATDERPDAGPGHRAAERCPRRTRSTSDNPVITPKPNAYPGGGFVRVVETQDVTLNIIPATDSQKVRAWVRHPGVQTFFGGLIGKPYGHVQAMATAWASNEGPTPKCLKPFLIPDMWFESDKVNQDKNNNNYMEPDATANGNGQWAGRRRAVVLPALADRRLLRAIRSNRDEPPAAADWLREQLPRLCRGRGAADPLQAADREQPAARKLVLHPGR